MTFEPELHRADPGDQARRRDRRPAARWRSSERGPARAARRDPDASTRSRRTSDHGPIDWTGLTSVRAREERARDRHDRRPRRRRLLRPRGDPPAGRTLRRTSSRSRSTSSQTLRDDFSSQYATPPVGDAAGVLRRLRDRVDDRAGARGGDHAEAVRREGGRAVHHHPGRHADARARPVPAAEPDGLRHLADHHRRRARVGADGADQRGDGLPPHRPREDRARALLRSDARSRSSARSASRSRCR